MFPTNLKATTTTAHKFARNHFDDYTLQNIQKQSANSKIKRFQKRLSLKDSSFFNENMDNNSTAKKSSTDHNGGGGVLSNFNSQSFMIPNPYLKGSFITNNEGELNA